MLLNNVYNNLFELRDLVNYVFNTPKYENNNYVEPYCNIFDKEDSIFVKVMLPGVNTEDLNIELNDKTITIKGSRKKTNVDNNIKYLRQEREFGDFTKVIQLKTIVDQNNISANYSDGILSIELKKSPEEKPRKININ